MTSPNHTAVVRSVRVATGWFLFLVSLVIAFVTPPGRVNSAVLFALAAVFAAAWLLNVGEPKDGNR